MKLLGRYKLMVLESPGWKTFFSVVIPIITGLLSGFFIAEISKPTGLKWIEFYQTVSFYGLLIIIIIIYSYNRALFSHETNIQRFSDTDYCLAYVRSKCLPEVAEKYKDQIRQGKGGEFLEAMKELKKSLK